MINDYNYIIQCLYYNIAKIMIGDDEMEVSSIIKHEIKDSFLIMAF